MNTTVICEGKIQAVITPDLDPGGLEDKNKGSCWDPPSYPKSSLDHSGLSLFVVAIA